MDDNQFAEFMAEAETLKPEFAAETGLDGDELDAAFTLFIMESIGLDFDMDIDITIDFS